MWIGTRDGLNKYDGYQFQVFRHIAEDNSSISNNTISAFAGEPVRAAVGRTDGGGLNWFDPFGRISKISSPLKAAATGKPFHFLPPGG